MDRTHESRDGAPARTVTPTPDAVRGTGRRRRAGAAVGAVAGVIGGWVLWTKRRVRTS